MYEVVEQPMTDELRARILASKPTPPSPFRGSERKIVGHAFAFVILLGVAGVMADDLKWNQGAWPVAVVWNFAVIAYAFTIYRLIARSLRERRKQRDAMMWFKEAVMNAKVARIEMIESNDVVEIIHDDGIIFLFAIDANSCFWIEPSGACDNWPNSKFEMIRIEGVDEDLGPFCFGKKLRARKTIAFDEFFDDFDFDTFPEDGVIEQSIDSFLESARANSHVA